MAAEGTGISFPNGTMTSAAMGSCGSKQKQNQQGKEKKKETNHPRQ